MNCKNKCPLKASRHNDDYTLGYCNGMEQGYEKAREKQEQTAKWHLCKEELPNESGEYIVATTNGRVTIYGFTTDAYRLSIYDFDKYKGQNVLVVVRHLLTKLIIHGIGKLIKEKRILVRWKNE